MCVVVGYSNAVDIPDKDGMTPLVLAVTGGHINVLTYLLEYAPMNMRSSSAMTDPVLGASLLHWACVSDQIHIVDYLVNTHYVSIETRAKVGQCFHVVSVNIDEHYIIDRAMGARVCCGQLMVGQSRWSAFF